MDLKQYKCNDAVSTYCERIETYSNSPCDYWKSFQLKDYDLRSYTTPAKIVLYLMEPYLGCGHTVGVDTYYSEPKLFRILLEEKTNCIGTVKDRKYMPGTSYLTKLGLMNKGEIKQWYSRPINVDHALLIFAWQDQRVVRMITSFHSHKDYETNDATLDRRRKKHNNEIQQRPLAVVDYKKILPGVDRQDQVKAWADIYTEMKTRWIKSLLVGFAGYLFLAKTMTSK